MEDTLGGIGRPQELINEDLRQCDHAVFVWHDRWGFADRQWNNGGDRGRMEPCRGTLQNPEDP
jgi:hypothetical protein